MMLKSLFSRWTIVSVSLCSFLYSWTACGPFPERKG